ncbi:MAG: STAS domain-containing protein [Gammaproteobacteria bacterium]|nr:MAG: STAS domain-containing protein [Gammaproteobacteria bacterium]
MQRFTLPAQLDIRHVAGVHEALMAATAHGPVLLVASEVARVDTAGVQLLASALLGEPRAAAGLADVTPPLREALVSLGLAETLLADGAQPTSAASH